MRGEGFTSISVKMELRQRMQEMRARLRVRSYSQMILVLMDSYDGRVGWAHPLPPILVDDELDDDVHVEELPDME